MKKGDPSTAFDDQTKQKHQHFFDKHTNKLTEKREKKFKQIKQPDSSFILAECICFKRDEILKKQHYISMWRRKANRHIRHNADQNTKTLRRKHNNDHTTRTSAMKLFHLLCASIFSRAGSCSWRRRRRWQWPRRQQRQQCNHQLCHAIRNPIIQSYTESFA